MEVTADYIIRNENDFLSFLDQIKKSEDLDSDEFELPDVKFDGWPILDINVKGERYHSSITSSMLFGMSILNEEIQRAFATIRYGSKNLKKLTNEDKQQLDIVFNISEGSSDAEGTTDKIINAVITFLRDSMADMTGWQKMLIVIAIVGAASTIGYHYISQSAETERHAADSQVALVQSTSDGINRAIGITLDYKEHGQTEISKEVTRHGEEGKTGFVKQLAADPTVESVTLGQETLNRQQLNVYNGRQSVERNRMERIDRFLIRGVTKTGVANQDINISVTRASNDEEFTIKASGDIITHGELRIVLNALSSNIPIRISYLEVVENGSVSIGQFNSVVE